MVHQNKKRSHTKRTPFGTAAPPDFAAKKAKVGKAHKLKPNATSTKFKALQLRLPESHGEALLQPPDDAQRSAQGHTLQEALAKIGHYSGSVRREALHSLQSLLEAHPDRLTAPAALLATVEKIAPRAADEDASVRQALLSLLSALVVHVSAETLAPYFPLLLLHACSAMTKLDSAVRLDSLHLVDLWLQHCPTLVVQHGAKLLANFLHLVSTECKSNQARTLITTPNSRLTTMQGRMAVLRRLLAFLELALRREGAGGRSASEGMPAVAETALDHVAVYATASSFSIQAGLDTGVLGEDEPASASIDQLSLPALVQFAIKDLLPVLGELWRELQPEEQVSDAQLQLADLCTIVELASLLVAYFARLDPASECGWQRGFSAFVSSHLLPLFPLGTVQQMQAESAEVARKRLRFNCTVMDILVGLRLEHQAMATATSFLASLLNASAASVGVGTSAVLPLRDAELQRVMALAKLVLFLSDHKVLRQALLQHFTASPAQSSGKLQIFRTVAALLPEARVSSAAPHLTLDADYEKFVVELPRYLWEIGTSNDEAALAVVSFLASVAQRDIYSAGSQPQPLLDQLQAKLTLYFFAVSSQGQPVFGPFVKVSPELQRAVLHLLYYVQDMSGSLLKAVARCCHLQALPITVTETLLEIFALRCGKNAGSFETLASFVLAVALGCTWQEAAEESNADVVLVYELSSSGSRKLEVAKRQVAETAGITEALLRRVHCSRLAAQAYRRGLSGVAMSSLAVVKTLQSNLLEALGQALPLSCRLGLVVFAVELLLDCEVGEEELKMLLEAVTRSVASILVLTVSHRIEVYQELLPATLPVHVSNLIVSHLLALSEASGEDKSPAVAEAILLLLQRVPAVASSLSGAQRAAVGSLCQRCQDSAVLGASVAGQRLRMHFLEA